MRNLSNLFNFDISYFVRGSSWTTLSFIVGILGSLVTMWAFGNLLPRETYGIYSYLISLGASLSFLTLSGAGPAVIRAVARGLENLVPYALRLQLKYNSLAAILIVAVALYYGYQGNWLFGISLLFLALAYPIADAFHIYKEVLTGRKRFDILSHINNFITIIGAIATVITLYFTDNILILVALFTVMSFIPNVLSYKVATKDIRTLPDPEEKKEMRHTALHFTGAGAIGIIATYIDRIILFQIAGPAALALYSFALAGPERLKSFIKNIGSVAMPNLTNRSLLQIRQATYRRIILLVGSGVALSAFYWIIAPFLFRILLPQYLDAVQYSQVLSLALIAVPVSVYVTNIFSAQNMLKAVYVFNFMNHIGRITLVVVCAWQWGIWGLVVASIISNVGNAIGAIIIWEWESRRLLKHHV